MHTFVLHNHWALGDTVCLSALVRDIHRAYPGRYRVLVGGNYANVAWLNNPYCEKAPPDPKGQPVALEYQSGIVACNDPAGPKKHFLSWFHHSFGQVTGLRVPVTEPKGDLHLTPEERRVRAEGRYWVVVAGGKRDMTAKIWPVVYWQQAVDALADRGVRCVQAGADFRHHYHPRLCGVEQWVGRTRSERDFFALIANAEGVVCGVTAAMHVAAVFDKPCVVVAGGREAPWWEEYSNRYAPESFGPDCRPVRVEHVFLHTVGRFDCGLNNLDRGCWRDRAVPLEAADHVHPRNKARLCRRPVTVGRQGVPECLAAVTPQEVVAAVMGYYDRGVLPRPDAPRRTVSLPVVPDWRAEWTAQLPEPVPPAVAGGEPPEFAVLDHPYVGGRFTFFVLGHGDDLGLLARCLESIFATCPRARYDLRVALNQPSPRLEAYVRALEGSAVTRLYVDRGTRRKYPAMRQMFWDESCPITTPYVCWFDDDSWCRRPDWLPQLARLIRDNHPHGGRLYGPRYCYDLAGVRRPGAAGLGWFRAARWWQDRPLYAAGGRRLEPGGTQVVFASGGFWALATHVIREADIPDERLNHNGGDITIGCQVTQAGYKVVDFSPRPGKEFVAWSDAPRRGYREDFPWE